MRITAAPAFDGDQLRAENVQDGARIGVVGFASYVRSR
jgi:hypothetical protein